MASLTEHFDRLAAEQEATEAAQRETQDRIAKADQYGVLARCERLLADEDVAWFLGEMQVLVDAETDAALSLRNSAETARQHVHRRDMTLTITGWLARRAAQLKSELQAAK